MIKNTIKVGSNSWRAPTCPSPSRNTAPSRALTELSIYLQSWLLLVLLLLHTQTEDTSGLQKPQSCFFLPCPQ